MSIFGNCQKHLWPILEYGGDHNSKIESMLQAFYLKKKCLMQSYTTFPYNLWMFIEFQNFICVCVHACTHCYSAVSNSLRPHGLQPASCFLSMGFSRQEYWSGLPFPPPGVLPYLGIKVAALTSPELACRFFTTSGNYSEQSRLYYGNK